MKKRPERASHLYARAITMVCMCENQGVNKRFIFFSVALLTALYCGQRLWIISRTEVIGRDGTFYISMARLFSPGIAGAGTGC